MNFLKLENTYCIELMELGVERAIYHFTITVTLKGEEKLIKSFESLLISEILSIYICSKVKIIS